MEKREIYRKLDLFLDHYGLQPENAIEHWLQKKIISRQTLRNIIRQDAYYASVEQSNAFFMAESGKVNVGMFYYAEDKTFSKFLSFEKRVSGVVGFVDDTYVHGLIWTLHQKRMPWSSDKLCVYMTEKLSGKENTSLILSMASMKGKKAEAATYCAQYALDGVKAGDAVMACDGEFDSLYPNRVQVNAALRQISGAQLLEDYFYWTASEFSDDCAYCKHMGSGKMEKSVKFDSCIYVRPVIPF